ncbi:MAG: hypothetical protein E7A62_08860 [Actinomycetaceae bacterium]|nr:hypothetical protein [Actinomycetaceae bacterium]MDU0971081.1 hypothetical protein [Actinomycetaceae bacterium]
MLADVEPYLVERTLMANYIVLDLIVLAIFLTLLVRTKNWAAIVVAFAGGILYFVVDYGYFYLIAGTREVTGANVALFLFWMSMSYGITNMGWMWLFFDDVHHRWEWSLFIIAGWLMCAYLSPALPFLRNQIHCQRGVSQYHGFMALILFVAYGYLIWRNLTLKEGQTRAPIPTILFCGILIQFSWEAVLLLAGIRPPNFYPLIRNSLLETNLGAPIMWLIHEWYVGRQERRRDLVRPGAATS